MHLQDMEQMRRCTRISIWVGVGEGVGGEADLADQTKLQCNWRCSVTEEICLSVKYFLSMHNKQSHESS